ncbi:MAG: DUF3565 domain-containing protein [Pseudomonas sp.]|nr:DUF3565 domain-containing protein [Pseudomonas sp.]
METALLAAISMGLNLLRKNKERTSLTKAPAESEPSADQRMQICRDEQLLDQPALVTHNALSSIKPASATPLPRLLDFHQDADGHWVASLSCGHTQHLRHQPPWQNRAWVMAAAQRQARLGELFPCGWCAQQAADSINQDEND